VHIVVLRQLSINGLVSISITVGVPTDPGGTQLVDLDPFPLSDLANMTAAQKRQTLLGKLKAKLGIPLVLTAADTGVTVGDTFDI
jgi:hypothetical protein